MEASKIIDTVLRNVAFNDDGERECFIDLANELFNKFNGDICWEHSIFGVINYEEHLTDSSKRDLSFMKLTSEWSARSREQAKTECKRVMDIITDATEDREKQQCLFLFYVLFRHYNQNLFWRNDDEEDEDGDEEMQDDLALYDGVKRIVRESWKKVTISFNSKIDIDTWVYHNFDWNCISVSIKTKNKQTYNFNFYEKMSLIFALQMGGGELVSDLKLLASIGGSKTYTDSDTSAVKEWWFSKTLAGKANQSTVNKYYNIRSGNKRNSIVNRYYKDILFPIHKYITDIITLPYTKIQTDLIFDLFKLDADEFGVLASNKHVITKGKKADTQIIIDSYKELLD